ADHASLGILFGQDIVADEFGVRSALFQAHDKVAVETKHGAEKRKVDKVAIGQIDTIGFEAGDECRRFRAVFFSADLDAVGNELQHVQMQIHADLSSDLFIAAAM